MLRRRLEGRLGPQANAQIRQRSRVLAPCTHVGARTGRYVLALGQQWTNLDSRVGPEQRSMVRVNLDEAETVRDAPVLSSPRSEYLPDSSRDGSLVESR
jgi:hypothetical protein